MAGYFSLGKGSLPVCNAAIDVWDPIKDGAQASP